MAEIKKYLLYQRMLLRRYTKSINEFRSRRFYSITAFNQNLTKTYKITKTVTIKNNLIKSPANQKSTAMSELLSITRQLHRSGICSPQIAGGGEAAGGAGGPKRAPGGGYQ